MVVSTIVFPHHLGASIPCNVKAKKINKVPRASPRSRPEDVRKLRRPPPAEVAALDPEIEKEADNTVADVV